MITFCIAPAPCILHTPSMPHSFHFAEALGSALKELEISQKQFAASAGMSPAMVAKLISKRPGRPETYRKVFNFFRADFADDGDSPRKRAALRLARAFIQDTMAAVGIREGFELEVHAKGDHAHSDAVLHMFGDLPRMILLALFGVGVAAKSDDITRNQLLALAEACSGSSPGGFPKEFFASALSKPPPSRRLIGGSVGDLLMQLDP